MRLETGWLDDTPSDDNLTRRFLVNQAELNVAIAEAAGGRVASDPDLVLADAASPVPFMNQAITLRPPDESTLDRLDAFFASAPAEATFLSAWPTPDLRDRGWQLMGHPMFVARPPFTDEHTPRAGVAIRSIDDLDGIGVVEQVLAEGFPLPVALGAPPGSIFPAATLEHGLVLRVGELEGAPVAAGAAHASHGVVNLCSAATLPAARRQGVWEALVRSRAAVAPYLPAVAYTSDDSRPGFVRMGFLPLFRLTLWLRPAGGS